MAALEPVNALLHWTPDLSLPDDWNTELRRLDAAPDEATRLAAPLARRLGLRHIAHIDDHSGIEIAARTMATLDRELNARGFQAEVEAHPALRRSREAARRARDTVDLWPQLLCLNSAGAVHDSFDLETGLYLRAELPGGEHRARVAQWDARNLFMAARLRVATAQAPGGRVLACVGSAHKGPLEAALSALGPDLRLAQLTELES